MKNTNENTPLRWILLIALSLIWGSSFILIKKGLEQYGFIQAATLRLMTGALVLLPIAVVQFKKIPKQKLKYIAMTGILAMFLPAYLFCFAQLHIQSSVAGILNALTPTCTLLIAIIFFKNKFSKNQLIGLILGLAASIYLGVLSSKSGWGINGYVVLVILATMCYGANINIVKNYLADVPALAISACSVTLAGFLAMVIFFLPRINTYTVDRVHLNSLIALMTLGLLGTALAIVIHNYLIKISSALFASANTYFIPIVAVGWGLIFGETLSIYHLIGIIGILSAVLLIRKGV